MLNTNIKSSLRGFFSSLKTSFPNYGPLISKTVLPFEYDRNNPEGYEKWIDYVKSENHFIRCKEIINSAPNDI